MVDQLKSNIQGEGNDTPEIIRENDIHPELQRYIDASNQILNLKSFKRGYIISGLDFRYLWVSQNIVDYIGLTRQQLLGKLPEDFSVSVKNQEIIKQLQEAIDGKETEEIEFEVKLNDNGRVMILKKIVEALNDTNGKVMGILSTFEDITEKKKQEQKEKEQKLFFKEAEESAGAGAYREFLDAGIWIGSDNLCKILGIQGGEIKRNNEEFFAYVHPDDKSMLIDYYQKIIAGEIPEFDKEYRMIRPDNHELIWVHGKGKVKKDEQSGKLILSGIIIDTTEKKRDQVELRKVRELLISIASSTPDFISTTDLEGRFTFGNKSLAQFLGLKESEVIGKTFNEILGLENCFFSEIREEIEKTGKPLHREMEITNNNGDKKILSTLRGPIFDENGKLLGIFNVCRDVTDVKEKERRLDIAEKMTSVFTTVGTVLHDFRNVLTVISGNTQFLSFSEDLSEKDRKFVEALLVATNRATALTRRLSKIDKNSEIEKKKFDIYKIVIEAFEGIKIEVKESVERQILITEGVYSIIGDESEIYHALVNLGKNSLLSMQERGFTDSDFIRISAENCIISDNNNLRLNPGNYIKIIFEDNGDGIPPHILKKVYEPGVSTRINNGGSGLGLSVIYTTIVYKHGGAIDIKSVVGKGTKVIIYLPSSN